MAEEKNRSKDIVLWIITVALVALAIFWYMKDSFSRTESTAGAWAVPRLNEAPVRRKNTFHSHFSSGLRRQQEFGGDEVFQGAAHTFEYGSFFRAASSLLLPTHQFVKIGRDVISA